MNVLPGVCWQGGGTVANQDETEKAELFGAGARAFADSDFDEATVREIAGWELPDYDSDAYGRGFVLAARDHLAAQRP
jgi:hypothetical protein